MVLRGKSFFVENDSSLHTQLWIDPTEEFVQYNHIRGPVDVTFGVKESKVSSFFMSLTGTPINALSTLRPFLFISQMTCNNFAAVK